LTKWGKENGYSATKIHCIIIWLLSLYMTQLVYLNVCLVSFKFYLEIKHMSYLPLRQDGQNSRISSIKTKKFEKVQKDVRECAVQNKRQNSHWNESIIPRLEK